LKFFVDNWFLFATALISGGLLLWPLLARGTVGGKLTPAAAVTLINREKAQLIDISEPGEYAALHAGGARNVPLGQLETSNDLPRNKALPLVVVCANGMRSSRGVAILKKRGYERAQALAGGLAAWREANLPVERAA